MSGSIFSTNISMPTFWSGSASQLPEENSRDSNTLYFVIDGENSDIGTAIYKGSVKLGLGSAEAPSVDVSGKVNVVAGTAGNIVTFVGGTGSNNIQDSGKKFTLTVSDDDNTVPTNSAVKTYVDSKIPAGLFHITSIGTSQLKVSEGFAICNGTLQHISGGTVTGTLTSGWVVLNAGTITNGVISNPAFVIISDMSSPTTAKVYPLGHITVESGTVSAIESYHPTTAIFLDVATCSN